ncbi:hypothetical protein CJD36_013955 [Flavipsychrobacter stenotrophus]|uniref:TM2 domain-containing protein n=1 Tax=Flavipsychrobacter stenotrophus TaxID=2077091 RepID=A0A2S7SVX3_9BACT|nr:hypothetical protein [Flavipsychrobacter stenotrophus]PQJ11069.1 hypothetical protein CJD36_013955 [Flavipsychrobacter stenotrophus]
MKIRTLSILLFISMILSTDVQAAFPLFTSKQLIADTPIVARGEILIAPGPAQRKKATGHNGAGNNGQPTYKKRSKASFLALIGAIPFLSVAMGLHRIYLGYYTQGLIRLASPYLLIALMGIAMAMSPAAGLLFAVIFVDVYLFLIIWQIVDSAHISNGKLQPKHGKYRDRKTVNDDVK